jgi:hypothetical protein
MAQTHVTMDQFLRLSKRLDHFAQRINDEVVIKVFPVGSLYLSLTEENPARYLGGQWERYAKGCCLVGVDPDDVDFAQAGQKTGAKTVALTGAQNGAHTHVQNAHTHTQEPHTHIQHAHTHMQEPHTHLSNIQHTDGTLVTGEYLNIGLSSGQCRVRYASGATAAVNQSTTSTNQCATAVNQSAAAVNQPSGSGEPHSNIQPSVPVYIWVRVA